MIRLRSRDSSQKMYLPVYRDKNDSQCPLYVNCCSKQNFPFITAGDFCSFHNLRRLCSFHNFIQSVSFITYFCEKRVKQGGILCQFHSVWSGNHRDPIKAPSVSGGRSYFQLIWITMGEPRVCFVNFVPFHLETIATLSNHPC